jgi:hypothetical protein
MDGIMFDQDMYSQQRQPYGYDMGNTMPQPMSSINTNQVPAFYPSTLTPNLSEQTFMPADQGGKPMYRRGGRVRRFARGGIASYAGGGMSLQRPYHPMPVDMMRQPPNLDGGYRTGGYKPTPEQVQQMYPQQGYGGAMQRMPYHQPRMMASGGLAKLASRVQAAGTDGDTILAHINPLEAAQLSRQSGGPTINPETGLPSYKFKLGKVLKKVAQVAAPFVGGAIAGPAGAAVGGGLAGLMGGGDHKIRNALIGAGLGYAGAGGLGELGGVGNIIPGVNNAVGLTGLAGNLGLGGMSGLGALSGNTAVKAGATIGAKTAAANAAKAGAGSGIMGGLQSIFGEKDPVGNALLATTIAGGLGGILGGNKNKGGENIGGAGSIQEGINAGLVRPGNPDRRVKPTERVQRILSDEQMKALEAGGNPEWQYFEDVNPQVQYMAHGGYLDGHDGGQEDTIPAQLSDGEYVISADVVSNLGDGNNRKGAKKLDMLMKNSRSHKYAKGGKGLPPKSKSLEAYMKAKRRA